jgi:hypothetical protein
MKSQPARSSYLAVRTFFTIQGGEELTPRNILIAAFVVFGSSGLLTAILLFFGV